jgi:hypothetical protein
VIATSVDVELYPVLQRAFLVPIAACSMVAGGAFSGALIAVAGQLGAAVPDALRSGILVAVCASACICDLIGARVPTSHWQVPRWWARWPWPLFHVAFGFILGMGWLTIVPFASYYLLLAVLFLLGSIPTGVIVMSVFGLARSLPLLVMSPGIFGRSCATGVGARSSARRRALHAVADSRAMWVFRATTSIAVFVMLL